MKPQKIIRRVGVADLPALVELCQAHAKFEQAVYDSDGKASNLAEQLCGPEATCICLVVELGGELVGYASMMKQYSTWEANYYMYLDCLFLKEGNRGLGLGHEIMDAVKTYARSEGCTTVQWQTPDFNQKAIKFYQKLGAQSQTKQRFFWNLV